MLRRVGAAVFNRRLGHSVAAHDHVAVAAGLVFLSFLGVALSRITATSFDLGGEGLKVGVDDVRGWELLVVVLEGQLVFTLFRHFHPHSCFADPPAVGFVRLQQVFSWGSRGGSARRRIYAPYACSGYKGVN